MMTRLLAVLFGVLGRLTPGDQGRELVSVGQEFASLTRRRQPAPPSLR
jgi:hypothetical protein